VGFVRQFFGNRGSHLRVRAGRSLNVVAVPVTFFARRLSGKPLVFIAPTSEDMPIGPIGVIGQLLRGRRAYALINTSWTLENPRFLSNAVSAYRRHAAAFPEHRLLFLCNSSAEAGLLETEGIPAVLCNRNLFVDEDVFCIDPAARKDFEAIYVAVISRYKRHALCRDLPSVALMYYDPHTRTRSGYFAELKETLPKAIFINEQYAQQRFARPLHRRAEPLINRVLAQRRHVNLSPQHVAACINRARVGLCLSEEEGAMVASMEYLLCGVPVVTTASRGGRDYFFAPEFCTTVEPEPRAVERAVADLARSAPPAQTIRAATLEKVRRERLKLRDILQTIFETEGIMPRFADAWRNMPLGGFSPRWTVDRFLSGD
jgi:glycosyltransferase involved in cell wall biosynthesis